MPELPEVETITRQLKRNLSGRRVSRIDFPSGKLRLNVRPPRLRRGIVGLECADVRRDGKAIILAFESGASLIFRLGMTGKLLLSPPVRGKPAHTHLEVRFEARSLFFSDARRFGSLSLLPAEKTGTDSEPPPGALDPTSRTFTLSRFKKLLKGKARIKTFLLDQGKISGLGNIYVNECLFRAGIDPRRRLESLVEGEAEALYTSIRRVLREAIRNRGTTISDFCDAYGRPGRHQRELAVYGRSGEPCPRCRAPVIRVLLGGRATYLCETCQPPEPTG